MSRDLLLARFERYFAPPDKAHSVLQPQDRGLACLNLRRVLCILGYLQPSYVRSQNDDILDEELWSAVRKFQKRRHARVDGLVGPVTRRLLVSDLLENHGVEVFQRLRRPEQAVQVFISYASKDSLKVDKLHQWLRDKGIHVIRDQTDFQAGALIEDSIRNAVAVCDKVIAVYSVNSSGREWPTLETFVASELESELKTRLLIYLRLDETPLPERTTGRLHIDAREVPLKIVGEKLLQAISGDASSPTRYEYDENLPL